MNIKFDFSGKIVLITGAATGIGRETALKFSKAGASVAVVDINEDLGAKTAEDCKALGAKAIFYQANVGDENSVAEMGKKVLADFGYIDFLISNAGIGGPLALPVTNSTAAEARKVFDVNTIAFLNLVHAFYVNFVTRKQGKIVVTGSVAGLMSIPPFPVYAASKAATYSLVRSLSVELGFSNINVNAIGPGFVNTPIYKEAIDLKAIMPSVFDDCNTSAEVVNKMALNSALHRLQTEEDMANGILFLCTDEALNITGLMLVIDAGRYQM
jgi:NAD(P)-dependent dehydrogenase (short-subunit alcohol dehydrogenase family)